jgi:hypothetical protein
VLDGLSCASAFVGAGKTFHCLKEDRVAQSSLENG